MKIGLRTLVISAALSLLLVPAAALAQPVMPILYQGSVTIDGLDALVGTIVTAEINEVEVATNAPDGGTTEVGTYTLDIIADEGDTVVLKVWGEVGGESTYPAPWSTPVVFLDLSVGEISLPVAAFSASPLSGDEPLTVVFTDESQNMINNSTWSWDFGDGGTSTEASPTHQYLEAGSYTVTLTVTTDDGTDGEVKVDYIVVLAEGGFDPYTYDTDGTPGISYDEAVNAVNDYYAGGAGPTKADVLAVIKLYFS